MMQDIPLRSAAYVKNSSFSLIQFIVLMILFDPSATRKWVAGHIVWAVVNSADILLLYKFLQFIVITEPWLKGMAVAPWLITEPWLRGMAVDPWLITEPWLRGMAVAPWLITEPWLRGMAVAPWLMQWSRTWQTQMYVLLSCVWRCQK